MTWPAGFLAHRLRPRHAGLRRGVAALAALGLLTAMLTAVSAVLSAPAAQAATTSDWASEPLLLIHGFDDICQTAWNTLGGSGEPADNTASGYLAGNFKTVEVGYYNNEVGCGNENLNSDADPNMAKCNSLPDVVANEPEADYGTINDHIDRLGCLLAWYIYDNYTAPSSGPSVPVNVLAHSMGGLITQDAIGATSAGVADFPPHPLRVLRAVTVATPHGGIPNPYYFGAQQGGLSSNELADMAAASKGLSQSQFLTTLAGYGKPQGAGGTFWGLVGASDSLYYANQSCPFPPAGDPMQEGNSESCAASLGGDTPYPDGDGVVPAVSQMGMPADKKVLYGIVDNLSINVAVNTYVADPATQYEHETDTGGLSGNLQPPFYLNDGRTGATLAFECTSACGATADFSDLNLTSPASAPYSLAEITSMLETPVVANASSGGQFSTEWLAQGGATGANLGLPLGYVRSVSGGQAQDFQNGTIYWSGTATHAIYGGASTDYSGLGGPSSPLGFPSSDADVQPGGGSAWVFPGTSCGASGITGSGSTILIGGPTYTSGKTSPASEVQGCIWQAYETVYGGPAGGLGYPTTNEGPMGSGRVNYFTGGAAKPGCSTGSEPSDGMSTAAIYWNGAAHDVTGCIFAEYHTVREAAGELGFPTDDAYAYNGGHQQDFQNGYIFDSGGTATVTLTTGGRWVVGHAQHAGNDYPYETVGQFEHQNEGTDAWNEYYGQCDSFAAWKAYENLAGNAAQLPTTPVPAVNWTPTNASVSPVNQFTWGNADIWATKWKALGYSVNNVPTPGAIVWWPNAIPDPQDNNPPDPAHGLPGSNTGHVGYVTDVYPDGSINVEMYNMRVNGEYSVVHMAYNQGYTDNSFGLGNYSVPWPGGFIHVADGPAPGVASPAEPSPGVVQATYPSQVKVIGPGSSASQFTTSNVWYPNAGFGEIGQEKYTHTNGPTAVSTATWTPSGLAGSTCYQVDALVPNEYSDNPAAVYTVSDAKGTSMAAVNENQTTSDWAELGVYETNSSGTGLTVKLDDRGTTGLWVAADAMRFWRQASCSGRGDVSPIVGPSSHSTTGWTSNPGHGFFGNQLYSLTHGTTVTDTASYTPHLIPLSCYEVFAYVPDNHSDNNAATYWVLDQWYGAFWPQLNENSFTNQFTDLGMFMSRTDGSLPVTLQDLGPPGEYVSADALAYTLDANCKGIGESGTGIGNVYQADQIGPGSVPQAFSTTNQWYTQLGHGYANHELWTYDNGSTADSTATWTFHGSASTCYAVSAFIPDNFADNPQAHYAVGSTLEGFGFTFDQATATGWSSFGAVTTGSNGVITVTLNDVGPTTPVSYTAADAMQFAQGGPGC
jgi:surface antigen